MIGIHGIFSTRSIDKEELQNILFRKQIIGLLHIKASLEDYLLKSH